jgi:hypothetical protein
METEIVSETRDYDFHIHMVGSPRSFHCMRLTVKPSNSVKKEDIKPELTLQ